MIPPDQSVSPESSDRSDRSDPSDDQHHLLPKHGGFTERLHTARTQARQRRPGQPSHPPEPPSDPPPACPRCGQPMRLRMARFGPRAGQPFWGCSAYPDCKGIRPADKPKQ